MRPFPGAFFFSDLPFRQRTQHSLTTLNIVGQVLGRSHQVKGRKAGKSAAQTSKENQWATLGCTRMFRKLLLPSPYSLEPRAVRSPPEHDNNLNGQAGKHIFWSQSHPTFFNDCFLAEMVHSFIWLVYNSYGQP